MRKNQSNFKDLNLQSVGIIINTLSSSVYNTTMLRRAAALKNLGSSVLRRTYARTTVLPNGMTVATEQIPNTLTATVGVWIDAGSRADVTDATSGTAHFLEHLAFKGTGKRTQTDLELEVENVGSHLNAYTSRENTVYYAKTLKEDIGRSVDILADILTRSKLEKVAIERERPVIIRESEEVDKMYDEVVFDRLHEVVYQGQPLGRTILGPIDCIKSISQKDLKNYITTNYKGDRMVLVGAGNVDHDDLVRLAVEHFGHVPPSDKPLPLGTPRTGVPEFHAGDVHVEFSDMPTLHGAISFPGESWSSVDYFTALTAQAVVGNWDRASGAGGPTPLARAVANNSLANSYMSFSTSYSDSGLWGVYFVQEKGQDISKLTKAFTREWRRVARGEFREGEIEAAKSQLRGALLLALDGSTAVAEDIGRQLVTTGTRMGADELRARIEAVDAKEVARWAQKHLLSDKIAVATVGAKSSSDITSAELISMMKN